MTASPEDQIGWAITCLRDNHMWGWHEIGGTAGFVNCSRDGGVATRVYGAVMEHSTVEDAALRIAETDAA